MVFRAQAPTYLGGNSSLTDLKDIQLSTLMESKACNVDSSEHGNQCENGTLDQAKEQK